MITQRQENTQPLLLKRVFYILLLFVLTGYFPASSQNHSVARKWNDALLEAIRLDYARPTVHARNLLHSSIVMYDAWAIYDQNASTYLIGHEVAGYTSEFDSFEVGPAINEDRDVAISFAAYRLLSYRFQYSPNQIETQKLFDDLMNDLGYDKENTSVDYSANSPIALGNYIAQEMIAFGLQDGSNEEDQYANKYYTPVNEPLLLEESGAIELTDPNRWQPLAFDVFVDQAGNPIPLGVPEFLSPEWGNVVPFCLQEQDLVSNAREEHIYHVYKDPGAPPTIDSEEYKWGFSLVSAWSSHLDPTDGVMWDISPASIGNLPDLPKNTETYASFYDFEEGGDSSEGRSMNPITGEPYEAQLVPRGDYARVLAEFWADGPDSETPPGHWFTILNYVTDHNSFEKRMRGEGELLSDLEWDVKAYFTLAGAMHDAAITAWGIKGWYDYIRPISALRYMAVLGQSSDEALDNYHENGIPLTLGYIELVQEGDVLSGNENENVGKVKLFAWKGHSEINDPAIDQAGVDWILAEEWWPYQRPTFVTPPFAGYVSGHSTYSRAAAEVLTLLTGDEYFPGGMGEFLAKKNEFLVFEEGPSMDINLQWATYRDASDQCSLSRIWGGIHPPVDDIPGRIIGAEIGVEAFELAQKYFSNTVLNISQDNLQQKERVFPNPVNSNSSFIIDVGMAHILNVELFDIKGSQIPVTLEFFEKGRCKVTNYVSDRGILVLSIHTSNGILRNKIIIK